jgi:hypothetical protein
VMVMILSCRESMTISVSASKLFDYDSHRAAVVAGTW